MIATSAVVVVLYIREYRSAALRMLDAVATGEKK
jgi:uncharacterized membrane protein